MNQRHQITRRTRTGLVGIVAATVAAGAALTGAPAQAADRARPAGDRSLAQVLAADKGFDHNWNDFDILDKAVTTVLSAKPGSPVTVLADGSTRLTAFLPTDRAFRRLATELTGRRPHTERGTFRAIAGAADVDTIETILLYHVVPGVTAGSRKVVRMNGARLTMANGGTVTIRVRPSGVRLADQDPDARNADVIAVDVNKGNKQIAHVVNRVLRPVDL
jgi:uncharacterized surface protein with fasciclin (FAS1) repeats